jgi:hypothetical protein
MTTGKINKNRLTQSGQIIVIEFSEMKRWSGFVRIVDVHHLTHDNSRGIPEAPCPCPVGEHAVKIMSFLIYILKEQDPSGAIQLPRRSEKRLDKCHTAADQDPFSDSRRQDACIIG